MGLVYTNIWLKNPREDELEPLEVQALVDTGSMLLCIPEYVAIQLKLVAAEQREVTLADGSTKVCAYVGPIELRFKKRSCYTGALVLGDQVLLGAVAMEDLDLVISPLTRTVEPNPRIPNIPSTIVKAYALDEAAGAETQSDQCSIPNAQFLSEGTHVCSRFLLG